MHEKHSFSCHQKYLQFSRIFDSAQAMPWCYIRTMSDSKPKTAQDAYEIVRQLSSGERDKL